MADIFEIAGRIHSTSQENVVTTADQIKDETQNKKQNTINADVARHENEIHGTGGIDSRLTDVEQMEQIVIGGGDAQIATGADFTNPDATKRAKVPTVGAIVDGLNDGVYDVSKRNPTAGPNSDGKFTLDYILSNANTLIPTGWRHGGMTISFVDSSDNKYVQFRCMKNTFSTTVTDWQGVDDEPTPGSRNLIESGGVPKYLKQYNFNKTFSQQELDTLIPLFDVVCQHSPIKALFIINDVTSTFDIASTPISIKIGNKYYLISFEDGENSSYFVNTDSATINEKSFTVCARKPTSVGNFNITIGVDDAPVILKRDINSISTRVTQNTQNIATINGNITSINTDISNAKKTVDILNVNILNNKTDNYSDSGTARMAVPSEYRKIGKAICYKLNGAWYSERFIGTVVNDAAWLDEAGTRWERVYDLDIQAKNIEKTDIAEAFGAKLGDFSVSGNYTDIRGLMLESNKVYLILVHCSKKCSLTMAEASNMSGSSRIEPYILTSVLVEKKDYIFSFIHNGNGNYISVHNDGVAYDGVSTFSIYEANTQLIQQLELQIHSNTEDINTLFGIVQGGETPVENAVKYVPQNTLYLGSNILDLTDVTYDSSCWSVVDGVIKYNGTGNSEKTFKFNTLTEGTKKYLCDIITHTENDRYENLFHVKIGEGFLIDTYNGTNTTSGGFVSDGGCFEIIPDGSTAFDITSISLKKCLENEESEGYTETRNISVDNINCGNSARTLVDGKWNVAIGPIGNTMASNVSGSRSIAIGRNALNVWYAGLQNIAVGTFALSLLESGERNIAIGCDSLWQAKKAYDNIVIGKGALGKTGLYTEMKRNIAIGNNAMGNQQSTTTKSVAVGYNANYYGCPDSVFIGDNCYTLPAHSNITNVIAIGKDVRPTKSNQCILGNASVTEFVLGNKKLVFNNDNSVTWETIS